MIEIFFKCAFKLKCNDKNVSRQITTFHNFSGGELPDPCPSRRAAQCIPYPPAFSFKVSYLFTFKFCIYATVLFQDCLLLSESCGSEDMGSTLVNNAATMRGYCEIPGKIGARIRRERDRRLICEMVVFRLQNPIAVDNRQIDCGCSALNTKNYMDKSSEGFLNTSLIINSLGNLDKKYEPARLSLPKTNSYKLYDRSARTYTGVVDTVLKKHLFKTPDDSECLFCAK